MGYAKRHNLFPAAEMVCTHTLCNEARAGIISLGVMELPEAMKRKPNRYTKPRENKKSSVKALIYDQKSLFSVLKKDIGKATTLDRSLSLLLWTMDLSFPTSLSAKNGARRSVSPIPVLHGSNLRTNGHAGSWAIVLQESCSMHSLTVSMR